MFHLPMRAAVFAVALVLPISSQAAEVSFTDHRGKTITLDAHPKRLLAIPSAAAINYYAVDGGADDILAVHEQEAYKTFTGGIHGRVLPELLDRVVSVAGAGFVPNVEAILELHPDLIIQWTHDPEIIEPLERVGFKVVGYGCCTEAQRRDYLTFSGFISGRTDRAQKLLAIQDESNAALRQHFASMSSDDYVSMLEIDKLDDQIQVVANSSQDYALSGVATPAADDTGEWWRTVDVEQVIVWNPQIIIIPAWEPDLTPSAFYGHPLLGSVDAIRNHRVYKVPKFNESPDTTEVYLTAQWLAAIAHPGSVPDGFRQRVVAAYQEIYGKDISAPLADDILEMKANADSEGYLKLFGGT